MEFPFDVSACLPGEISAITARQLRAPRGRPLQSTELGQVIDRMGEASAKAQDLKGPITSCIKLSQNQNHLYVLRGVGRGAGPGTGRQTVLGIIKVGFKNLFILDSSDHMHEIKPLCVLDFYVHESCQRTGKGRRLFEYMLEHEQARPFKLGYDRPSSKFIQFLAKHYGLTEHRKQMNNFVVFEDFFRGREPVLPRPPPLVTRQCPAKSPQRPQERAEERTVAAAPAPQVPRLNLAGLGGARAQAAASHSHQPAHREPLSRPGARSSHGPGPGLGRDAYLRHALGMSSAHSYLGASSGHSSRYLSARPARPTAATQAGHPERPQSFPVTRGRQPPASQWRR